MLRQTQSSPLFDSDHIAIVQVQHIFAHNTDEGKNHEKYNCSSRFGGPDRLLG
jgi:hypothetical protein